MPRETVSIIGPYVSETASESPGSPLPCRYLLALTGNNHHLEGINELPPAARLRGLRVTCLKYGE